MIRINLLPFRAARKRENIRRQVSISGLLFLLFLLLLGVWFISLSSSVSELAGKETGKKAELEGYKKELEELKTIETLIKEITTKLDVIKELEKGKTGPVLLLSTIADAVPKNKLFLTSFKESKGVLILTGTAMDNNTVSLFMDNLEKAKDMITSVDLSSVTMKEVQIGQTKTTGKTKISTSGTANDDFNKIKVADFSLECRTYAYKEKPVEETVQTGKAAKKAEGSKTEQP